MANQAQKDELNEDDFDEAFDCTDASSFVRGIPINIKLSNIQNLKLYHHIENIAPLEQKKFMQELNHQFSLLTKDGMNAYDAYRAVLLPILRNPANPRSSK